MPTDFLGDSQPTATRREFLEQGARLGAAFALAPVLRFVPVAAAATVDPRVRALARSVRGAVLTPASAAYDTARRVVNTRFDGIRPLAVVQPRDALDVQTVVRWAAKTKVPIVARSGGHSYAGYSTTRGVVIDLSTLAGVAVDAHGHAVVGAGARLGAVDAALGARGLAIPVGSGPSVGIGGLTLGGGFGLASRAWGLTCDNLVRVDIVTADGRLRRCDAAHDADLFWACRGGGGGNFGIVTRFIFRTHRVSSGSWFVASFPWTAVEAVVARFLDWAPAAPDALGPICRLATGTSTPTVQVFGQFLGAESALRTELANLTSGLPPTSLAAGASSWLDLVRRWGGCGSYSLQVCARPSPQPFVGASDYVAAALSSAGLAALRSTIERRGSAPAALIVDAYGGAVNRVAPGATAFVHRGMRASCQYYAGGDVASAHAWVRSARATMAPYVSGFAYQNYIDPDLAQWQNAYYGANLPRLQAVKRRYDPHNLFRFAQSIRPHS